MFILDETKQREAIRHTLKHYGTRTQGEDFRMEQVHGKLYEMIVAILDVKAALSEVNSECAIKFYVE